MQVSTRWIGVGGQAYYEVLEPARRVQRGSLVGIAWYRLPLKPL